MTCIDYILIGVLCIVGLFCPQLLAETEPGAGVDLKGQGR